MWRTIRTTSCQSALAFSASKSRTYVTACCRSYGVSVGSSGARSATSGSSGGTQETPIGREASIWRTLPVSELLSYRPDQAVYRILRAAEIKESLEHLLERYPGWLVSAYYNT